MEAFKVKIKSRAFKKLNLEINRDAEGSYIDGIYQPKIGDKFKIAAIVQPYQGQSYQQTTDEKVEKSSVILFTNTELNIGYSFEFMNQKYTIQRVDAYLNTNHPHFEAIASI